MRIVAEIVPRQTEQWPEGSHNKQLNLTYRKKSPDLGFLGNVTGGLMGSSAKLGAYLVCLGW